MTRYEIVRTAFVLSEIVGVSREVVVQRHPEQPADGFPTWTDAELWLQEHFLAPHVWRVEPTNG